MGLSINIFGQLIKIPDRINSFVEDWGQSNPKEQYWRRRELPDFFNNVSVDKDNNAILTDQQEEYSSEEVRRCKEGFYFLSNGEEIFITGKHYFYAQWWKLEDDIYADYRDTDRRYFLFLNYWESILWCLGLIRGKKRREGASSQAVSNLIYECIFFKNTNCGLISKTKDDSRDTFTDMLAFGYRQLPIFLKPKQINREASVTEYVFAHKAEVSKSGRVSTIQEEASHRSKVNYRAPVLNAYDRGRLSRVLLDEFGKLDSDAPASQLFSIIKKTLVKGVKRVGFCEMPSTVNSWKKGGSEFKKIWEAANQFQKIGNVTVNRLVKYISPAYDGYEGFIDKYGMSVIDTPTKEQYDYLCNKWVVRQDGELTSELSEEDIRLGAKSYVTIKRRLGLVGTDLEEEMRQNPCDEDEMFMAANSDCAFDGYAINSRLNYLKENPIFKRKVLFYKDLDDTVRWRDIKSGEESFHWKITQFPKIGEENKINLNGLMQMPGRTNDGAIAIDSYSNSQGGRKYGSKASALIGRKFDILYPEDTGKAIGHLYGRPSEKDELHEQVMLASIFYGYKAYYEQTSDDYDGYFKDNGMRNYLGLFPMNLIDKKKGEEPERHRGTPITPFSLSKQMDYGVSYFKHHSNLIDFEAVLENALLFDPYKRTEYDTMVSFLILLAVLQEPVYVAPLNKNILIKSYGQQRLSNLNPAHADY